MRPEWFRPRQWNLAHGRSLQLGKKSHIMGVVNVTPDSFSDGGQFANVDAALARCHQMLAQGASIIDIGGESTKPGSEAVSGEVERSRVLPIIEAIAQNTDAIISIDTYRAQTAKAAVDAGAHIVNDVWGCQREPNIADVAAATGAGIVIMNTRRERKILPDLLDDMIRFLEKSLEITQNAQILNENIVLDPGFGFAESTDHDIPILQNLERLHGLNFPILVGTSRKRFLGELSGKIASERDVATAATSVVARMKGAAIFRVHDIDINKDALSVADAVVDCGIKL